MGSEDTSSNGTYRINLFIMKIDTSGTIQWCKKYGNQIRAFRKNRACQIKATNSNGYIITGFTCDTTTFPYDYSDLIIIKTDANGDTIWTRSHGSKETEDGGDDIIETSDGGYLVSGYSSSEQFPQYYGGFILFKTDSLGMTSSHCQEFSTPIEVSNISANDSLLNLTILKGIVTVMPSNVLLIQDSIIEKDGCLLYSNVNNIKELNQTKIKVFPNPTNGKINLKNSQPTPPLKTIILYDLFGHEIFTKQNVPDQEPQLDLSGYAAGVYYIKVVQGGKVEWSKVVKQ